jgi:hypothetical protein
VHKSNSFSKYSTTVAFQNMLVTAAEDSLTGKQMFLICISEHASQLCHRYGQANFSDNSLPIVQKFSAAFTLVHRMLPTTTIGCNLMTTCGSQEPYKKAQKFMELLRHVLAKNISQLMTITVVK